MPMQVMPIMDQLVQIHLDLQTESEWLDCSHIWAHFTQDYYKFISSPLQKSIWLCIVRLVT